VTAAAAKGFMRDTNNCIGTIRHRPASAVTALRRDEADGWGVFVIIVADLDFDAQSADRLLIYTKFIDPQITQIYADEFEGKIPCCLTHRVFNFMWID
jgi:hypothetical protein